MPGKDTKTRYQGVYARHQKHCAIADARIVQLQTELLRGRLGPFA
jgi:hypothetical protein